MKSNAITDLASHLDLPPGTVPDWNWLMELIDDTEAAKLSGMKGRQSMRARRFRGDSPPYVRLSGHSRGRVFYRRIDLLKWVADHRHTSTSAESWPEPAVGALEREG